MDGVEGPLNLSKFKRITCRPIISILYTNDIYFSPQELDCFLLDENGYVVLSDISWEVSPLQNIHQPKPPILCFNRQSDVRRKHDVLLEIVHEAGPGNEDSFSREVYMRHFSCLILRFISSKTRE